MTSEYRYMVKIIREMTKYKELREKENHLTPSEETLLHLIRHNEGLSQKELVSLRNIDKAAITRQLDSLENKGYINRIPSKEDKRFKCIYSTEKAQNLKEDLTKYEDEFLEYIFEPLSSSEKQNFINTLTVLYHRSKQESRKGFPTLLDKYNNEK